MMLQDITSPRRRIDVLILQQDRTEPAGEQEVYRRLGVISLRHFNKEVVASDETLDLIAKAHEEEKKSLKGRINHPGIQAGAVCSIVMKYISSTRRTPGRWSRWRLSDRLYETTRRI